MIQTLLSTLNLPLQHCRVVLLHVLSIHDMFTLRLRTEHSQVGTGTHLTLCLAHQQLQEGTKSFNM